MPKIYRILDLDNCISDDGWRIPKINWQKPQGNERYLEYHLLCGFDMMARLALKALNGPGDRVIVLTGRPCLVRGITVEWLNRHGIEHDHLLMRNNDDQRRSVNIKRSMLEDLRNHYGIDPYEDIASAWDDHPEIVEMYKTFGIDARLHAAHQLNAYINPLQPEETL